MEGRDREAVKVEAQRKQKRQEKQKAAIFPISFFHVNVVLNFRLGLFFPMKNSGGDFGVWTTPNSPFVGGPNPRAWFGYVGGITNILHVQDSPTHSSPFHSLFWYMHQSSSLDVNCTCAIHHAIRYHFCLIVFNSAFAFPLLSPLQVLKFKRYIHV